MHVTEFSLTQCLIPPCTLPRSNCNMFTIEIHITYKYLRDYVYDHCDMIIRAQAKLPT